jgi:hypothetical protein
LENDFYIVRHLVWNYILDFHFTIPNSRLAKQAGFSSSHTAETFGFQVNNKGRISGRKSNS